MRAFILNFTDEQIDCNKTNIREQLEDIFDEPDNITSIEFTNNNDMLEMIHTALNKPMVGVSVCNLWEDKNVVYYGYFIDIMDMTNHSEIANIADNNEEIMSQKVREAQKKIKINMFASQLSSQNVASNMVIVKQQLSYNIKNNNIQTSAIPCHISHISELINICESIIVKDGIVLYVDGSMQLYKYIVNPIEHLMLTDKNYEKNYVYHEYEVYTYVMIIIADTRQCCGKTNNTASFLAGKPVNGDVFIAFYKKPEYNENPPYVSVSTDKLNEILSIRKKSPIFTTGMNRSDREYVNFEKIVELECNKHCKHADLNITDIKGELLNIK